MIDTSTAEKRPGPTKSVVPLLLGTHWYHDLPGGLARYMADLDAALRSLGIASKVTLVGPATNAPPHVAVAGRSDQPLVVRLWRYWRSAERWAGEATVVDAHFALYALLPVVLGRLRHRPLVVHFQGPWADESVVARHDSGSAVRVKRLVERSVYRRASAAVTLSTAFKRILVERYAVLPWIVEVVPPGVDLAQFRPGDRDEARRRLGLGRTAPVVLAVRRLDPRMGLDVLLEAWATARDLVPGGCLLIAGEGQERSRLENLVTRSGLSSSVRFLGRVDELTLRSCYQAADLTVVPTIALEGFGLVVLESLACGTPVVVTDAGGLPEALADLDPTAIVPAGDAQALADAIVGSLGEDSPRPDPARCRRHAEAHGWDRVARKHIEIYQRAISPARTRVRVAYLDHCAELAGGELALLTLLPALNEVDAHVILAEEGPLVSRLLRRGVSVEVLPMAERARNLARERVRPSRLPAASMAHSIAYVATLSSRIRRLRPDLVHTNSLKAAIYGGIAARLAGVPVVWHVRDRIAPDYLPAAAARAVRAMARRVPNCIIANSRTTLETLGRAGRRGIVIPSPVRVLPVGTRRSGAGRAPLHVGMVGRLAPWKGQHVFIEAFARAFPNGRARATIVGGALFGETDYAEELHSKVGELGFQDRIVLKGFSEDVRSELAGMDLFVHASVVPEPFGQVVVEAMSAGLPVVAADAGGPAEIIHDGIDGLLYPPGDVEALAGCLRRLASDVALRDRLARAAQTRAADFSVDRVAAEVMGVYRAILDPASSVP